MFTNHGLWFKVSNFWFLISGFVLYCSVIRVQRPEFGVWGSDLGFWVFRLRFQG